MGISLYLSISLSLSLYLSLSLSLYISTRRQAFVSTKFKTSEQQQQQDPVSPDLADLSMSFRSGRFKPIIYHNKETAKQTVPLPPHTPQPPSPKSRFSPT